MDSNIRIAFITPEAPPFSGGGIATFINNITKGLSEAGIFCEVFEPLFTGETEVGKLNDVTTHRVKTKDIQCFSKDIVPYFIERHRQKNFTIIESCEIHACLKNLLQLKIPGLKVIIRVQMPFVYQNWLNNYYQSRLLKLRYVIGALRRGNLDLGFWNKKDYNKLRNDEYNVCAACDVIIAPSNSFKKWLKDFWSLPEEKIRVVYHLFDHKIFTNSPAVIAAEVAKKKQVKVLFVGKLNAHKGVINLAKAARKILIKYSHVEFILIGEDWPINFGLKLIATSKVLQKIVGSNINFKMTGKVDYIELPQYYHDADICIFPSLWEAWGYTCTEAMSFGKAVIGSKYGGMADAIHQGVNGLLIDPFKVNDIAENIERLITDISLRMELGKNAKASISKELSFGKLLHENLALYKKILIHE